MGMGRGTQNASSGMQGKGGAARPSGNTQTQMGDLAQRFGGNVQQARSLGAKGMGQQPPQVQPQPGMGGKGVGQPPAQQPNLNNALSGLAGAPVQTYPFPQPPAQQPAAGMGGKGVGTRQLDPAMQPYVNNLVSGMQQAEPGVLDPSRYTNYGQPAPTPVAGMGAKGVGQFPPQQQPGVPNFVQPYFQDMQERMQREEQDFSLRQEGMLNSIPEVQQLRQMMAGFNSQNPSPQQIQQMQALQSAIDRNPQMQLMKQQGLEYHQYMNAMRQQADIGVGQFPLQTQADIGGITVSPSSTPLKPSMGALGQPTPPRPLPVRPLRQPARPAPVAARPNPLRTPQPVRPEPKNVANQRALQQLASRNRSRR